MQASDRRSASRKGDAPQIEDWGSRHEEPPQKHCFWGGGLRSKTEGAAMQSIAVEEG